MKKLYTLLVTTILYLSLASAQTTKNTSDWLFLRSDKPVEFQIQTTKVVGNKVYYKIHLRINENGAGFCTHPLCYGYIVNLPIYQYDIDTQKGIRTEFNFKIPKTYKGVYTIEGEFFKTKKFEEKGKLYFWDMSKNYPMVRNLATGEEERQYDFIYACVDTKRTDQPYEGTCNSKGFDESKAIEIK